jgi:formate hydrogenlyase transcriptional activator
MSQNCEICLCTVDETFFIRLTANRLSSGMTVETAAATMYLNALLGLSRELAVAETREQLGNTFSNINSALGASHSTLLVPAAESDRAADFLAGHQAGSPFLREMPMSAIPPDHRFAPDGLACLKPGAESDFAEGIRLNLIKGSELIAIWIILYRHEHLAEGGNPESLQLLANTIAMTAATILAHEQAKAIHTGIIASKDLEIERLLQLTQALTTVRNKESLLGVIRSMLTDFFDFREIVIMMLNTETSYGLFLAASGRPNPVTVLQDDYQGNYPATDQCFNSVMTAEDACILSMDKLMTVENRPSYVSLEYERGIREKIGVAIRNDNQKIGVLYVNTAQKSPRSDHQLQLIRSVSYHISGAISNILANEKIAQREAECDLLISLSNQIAAVRNNQELLGVISGNLKAIIGFGHSIIARIDDNGDTASAYLLDPKAATRRHPLYRQVVNSQFPLSDAVLGLALDAEGPLVFDLEELLRKDDLPLYLQMSYESGSKQLIIIRFTENGNPFGFWLIFFDHKGTFDPALLRLVGGIASQLSIAVLNIIANQQIRHQLGEISGYKSRLEEEKIYLQEEIDTTHHYADIIGRGPELQKVFHLVSQVAPSDSTVMILGETGTGKELIARAIHNNSPRRHKLMVKVNCAALPANLIESELFGHERGSFTGATEKRVGKFELANNGTLFLDEIGEMPLDLQVKLLRAIQEREIERVGGRTTITVDIRIIAATNRDLEKEVREGRFRADLYYRLNIFPIFLPPLRNRVEDIPLLATHFVSRFSKKTGKKITTISTGAIEELKQYSWPGNIRELEHLIERSILLSSGETLKNIALPATASSLVRNNHVAKTIDDNEREHILSILRSCSGKVDGRYGAAKILGIPASTLHSKMKRLGIKKEHNPKN